METCSDEEALNKTDAQHSYHPTSGPRLSPIDHTTVVKHTDESIATSSKRRGEVEGEEQLKSENSKKKYILVTLPEHAVPGKRILVRIGHVDGKICTVLVPKGSKPGDKIIVSQPKPPTPPRRPQEQLRSTEKQRGFRDESRRATYVNMSESQTYIDPDVMIRKQHVQQQKLIEQHVQWQQKQELERRKQRKGETKGLAFRAKSFLNGLGLGYYSSSNNLQQYGQNVDGDDSTCRHTNNDIMYEHENKKQEKQREYPKSGFDFSVINNGSRHGDSLSAQGTTRLLARLRCRKEAIRLESEERLFPSSGRVRNQSRAKKAVAAAVAAAKRQNNFIDLVLVMSVPAKKNESGPEVMQNTSDISIDLFCSRFIKNGKKFVMNQESINADKEISNDWEIFKDAPQNIIPFLPTHANARKALRPDVYAGTPTYRNFGITLGANTYFCCSSCTFETSGEPGLVRSIVILSKFSLPQLHKRILQMLYETGSTGIDDVVPTDNEVDSMLQSLSTSLESLRQKETAEIAAAKRFWNCAKKLTQAFIPPGSEIVLEWRRRDAGDDDESDSEDDTVPSDNRLRMSVVRPPSNTLPWVEDHCFNQLFACLSVPNVCEIFACLLTEESVLLIANDASRLLPVAEALRALLFPFRWTQVFVPVLPRSMVRIVECPVPYLIGVQKIAIQEGGISTGIRGVGAHAVVVDLDIDLVTRKGTSNHNHVTERSASNLNKKRRGRGNSLNSTRHPIEATTVSHGLTKWKNLGLPRQLQRKLCLEVARLIMRTPMPPPHEPSPNSPAPLDFKLHVQLNAFYRHWAPDKIKEVGQSGLPHLQNIQLLFKGRYEELIDKLVAKYGPEPAISRRSTDNPPRIHQVVMDEVREAFADTLFELIGKFHVYEYAQAEEEGKLLRLEGRVIGLYHSFIRRILRTHMWQHFVDETMQRLGSGVRTSENRDSEIALFDSWVDRRLNDGATRRAAAAVLFPDENRKRKCEKIILESPMLNVCGEFTQLSIPAPI
eukprot:g5068.t1